MLKFKCSVFSNKTTENLKANFSEKASLVLYFTYHFNLVNFSQLITTANNHIYDEFWSWLTHIESGFDLNTSLIIIQNYYLFSFQEPSLA